MFKFVTGSVQAKLVTMFLVMFALLAVTVALNFNAFGALDDSAPAVDQAGAQRMRVYKLSTLAAEYFDADAEHRVEIGAELDATIAQFDAVQAGLDDGNADLRLNGTGDQAILTGLANTVDSWASYKSDLQTVLASDTIGQEALAVVNEEADHIFNESAGVVSALNAVQVSVVDVDQAGAQRMRVYKAAFLSNAVEDASGEEREGLVAQLGATIAQFEAVQAGLKSGDPDLGLKGSTDLAVLAKIEATDQLWVDYRATLEAAAAGSHSALLDVDHMASQMFASSAEVVEALTDSQVSVNEIDKAGGLRMRAFKLAFLANEYELARDEEARVSLRADIDSTVAEFAATLAGLRFGDTSLGLEGSDDPGVIAALDALDEEWLDYSAELQGVLQFDTVAIDAIRSINEEAPVLVRLAAITTGAVNENAQGVVSSLKMIEIIMLVLGVVFHAGVIWYLRKTIVAAISASAEAAKDISTRVLPAVDAVLSAVAAGDLSKVAKVSANRLAVKSSDEVGQLGDAFNAMADQVDSMSASLDRMMSGLNERADVAKALAVGDLNVDFEPDSEKDVLGNAFASMVSGLKKRAEMAEDIAQGNLNVETNSQSENDVLGNAFQRMVAGLKAKAVVAEAIAEGDLDVEVTVESDDDSLGKAFVKMIETLKDKANVAEAIAAGDLSVNPKIASEKDTLGNALASMVKNLRELIGQMGSTADELVDASGQLTGASSQTSQAADGIAASAQEMARGIEDQVKSTETTNAAMGQLAETIESVATGTQEQASNVEAGSAIVNQVSSAVAEVARNAQSAADGARQASEAADSGLSMVSKTVEGMERIRTAVDSATGKIGDLGNQSAEIGKIVAVIDDIAAQTNLLALNAAIEAARAGEQGRGFAVVADEVRKLAERVAQSTSEIASLIEGVQTGVEESIKASEGGAAEVETGSELAAEAGKALNQIIESVQSVASQVEQISAAAEEVSASADEMVTTMDNISNVVEQNAAATEQISASGTEVSEAMGNIATVTQQNSAGTQEVSAAAEEVSAQIQDVVLSAQSLDGIAQELKEAVSRFNLNGASGNGAPGNGYARAPEEVLESAAA